MFVFNLTTTTAKHLCEMGLEVQCQASVIISIVSERMSLFFSPVPEYLYEYLHQCRRVGLQVESQFQIITIPKD